MIRRNMKSIVGTALLAGLACADRANAALVTGTTVQPSVWFDASQISTADLTNNATYVNRLDVWRDVSGNAVSRDANQAAGNRRPTYVPNAVNGLPAVRFNVNYALQKTEFLAFTGSLANTAASELHLFVVANDTGQRSPVRADARATLVNTRTNANTANGFALEYNLTPTTSTYAHVGHNSDGVGLPTNNFTSDDYNVIAVSRTGLKSVQSTYTDVEAVSLTANWSGFTASTLGTTQIGTEGGVHYLLGDIAEIIAVEGTLTPAQHVEVINYLGNKYSITQASLAVVPEPGSIGVVIAGIGTLILRRRRSA